MCVGVGAGAVYAGEVCVAVSSGVVYRCCVCFRPLLLLWVQVLNFIMPCCGYCDPKIIRIELVTAGADATVYIWPRTRHIPFQW